MSERDERFETVYADVMALSTAIWEVMEARDWDDERTLQIVGIWLTYVFNESGIPESAFPAFLAMLVATHERHEAAVQ